VVKKLSFFALALSFGLTFFSNCSGFNYEELMTWEEYYSQPRLKPYVFEMHTTKGDLLYYGVFHTVDSKNPQIREIERNWEKFKPTVAFGEGGIWPLEQSKEEAIKQHGEQGLLRYLAARDNVVIKSIEPNNVQEALCLLRNFPPDRIKVFYVLRKAAVNRMMKKDPKDTTFVDHVLNNLSRLRDFKCRPNTLDEFEEMVSYFFPDLKDWRMVPCTWFCSATSESDRWTSQMSRAVNDFRNKAMIRFLIREIKKGERVFAVVGRSHVVMQEPVLRSALRKFRKFILIGEYGRMNKFK
jgi:hypothetical protein